MQFLVVLCLILCVPVASEGRIPRMPLPRGDVGPFNVSHHFVPMRDGVLLFTSVWSVPQLDPGTKHPAVLDRTPYGPFIEETADIWLPEGFVAVMQNQRGTGLSEGDFDFWHLSADDAHDTIAWIQAQDWSNGNVFMSGFSADGIEQYCSMLQPQKVKGQLICWATAEAHPTVYQNGGYRNALITSWMDTIHEQRPWTPPYTPQLTGRESFDPWWAAITLTNWTVVDFPAIHWAGWYDIFLQHQLRAFYGYQNLSGDGARGNQFLIVEPRGHCFFEKKVEWANDRFGDVFAVGLSLEIFKAVNAGGDVATAVRQAGDHFGLKPITFYVMGPGIPKLPKGGVGDYWTTMYDWPVYTNQSFFMTSSGQLVSSAASSSTPLPYIYDPSNPVPSRGGNNLFIPCGPLDQTPVEDRPDVLVFTAAPFTTATAMVGNMVATLYVSSNATDTDFTVKVTDVYPASEGGNSTLLTDNIIRMRWREGTDQPPVPMTPGETYMVTVQLWAFAYVFNPGHSLRVDISSSNYPRFSVNPNNDLPLNATGPLITAENTLFVGGKTPSSISLPIVPLSAIPNNVNLPMTARSKRN